MRLTKKEIKVIKTYFNQFFNGEIYLFGSRIDDTKRGGDIDLYLKIENKTLIYKEKLEKIIEDMKIK